MIDANDVMFDDLEDLEDFYSRKGEKEKTLEKISGVAEYINTRDSAYGTMYALKVNGTNYSLGKTNPTQKFGVVKGDAVEFSAEQNAKGYWDIKGPVKKLEATPATAARPAAAAAVAQAVSYRAADENKQKVISRQAARNAAIEFLDLVQTAGALTLPKTKGEQFNYLRELLDKLTDEFYNDSLDPKPFDHEAPVTGQEQAAAADSEWGE